ncbi:MFS transporter [Oceanispirochaeta sp.]|jgi:OFA family oxalate/formate antiporter-like MFS transporter|uniref:MFS transporter n=1 Tax=Oceanispirochaeta sp. TaxID=2035350 RepID=UPI002607F70A|nr:MFS transporter [Oceanispirochaeta sp.]MDA3955256.1 MFS transporter [Oceanispirochaeta sp.]
MKSECLYTGHRFKEFLIKTEKNHMVPGHIPFSPRKVPFYYGWVILFAGAMGVLFSIPGQTMGVSVYTDHLIDNLHLSRIEISTAYMVGTLVSSLVMTRAGIFYDRFGARIAAAGSALGLGLCLMMLSRSVPITSAVSALLGFSSRKIAFVFMIIGFFGIRFFGQGVLTLVSRGMVMRWFEAHRGFAAAIMGIFTSFGFSFAPRVLQGLIDLSSWDRSWMIMGVVMIILIVPFIFTVFRDSPEECGIEMEEGLKIKTGSKRKELAPQRSYTLQEARRDPKLWCFILILFFWSMYNTGFTFHITSIFESQGKTTAQAVAIFLPLSFISLAFRFLGSWLSDIIDLKYHFYLAIFSMMTGAYALTLPYTAGAAALLIGGFGISGGLFGVFSSVTWPKLYGREHLGAISGMAMSFMVAGSALGPWGFSMLEKVWGNYRHSGWLGVYAAGFIGLVSFPFMMKKQKDSSFS